MGYFVLMLQISVLFIRTLGELGSSWLLTVGESLHYVCIGIRVSMKTTRGTRDFILPIGTKELGRDKNYIIDSDIWPRHIHNMSPRWELVSNLIYNH